MEGVLGGRIHFENFLQPSPPPPKIINDRPLRSLCYDVLLVASVNARQESVQHLMENESEYYIKLDQNSVFRVIECDEAQHVTRTFISCPSFDILDYLERDEMDSGPYFDGDISFDFYIRFPYAYTYIN